MKILCDEDVPEPVLEPLRHLLRRGHAVDHVNHVGWSGKKDRFVLPDAAARGYEAILTNDSGQLHDPAETDAIRRSGLHHIRYSQRQPGVRGLALAMGGIFSAMPGVVDELAEASGQRLVRIVPVSPRERYEVVDPRSDPPRYWR